MLSKERRKLLTRLVAESTPLKKMQVDHGFNHSTVRKYYPDYRKGSQGTVNQAIEQNQELVDSLAAERAPGAVIAGAIGVSRDNLYKNRPDLTWSKGEAGSLGGMATQLGRLKGV